MAGDRDSRSVIVLLLFLVAARIFLYQAVGEVSDDPYITYRYAENIASGKGFVFNPGEKVLGTSSPVYALILTLFVYVAGPQVLPTVSRLFSLISDVVSLLLLWRMTTSVTHFTARFLIASLFALYPKVVLIAISGMEACFVVMLMLLSYSFLERGKTTAACVIFGLLLLTRIDTVVWVTTCIVWDALKHRQVPARSIAWIAIVCLPWLLFSISYFGTWIPHSVVAKHVSWQHLFPVFDPSRVLLGYFPFRALLGFPRWFVAVALTLFLIPVIWEMFRFRKDGDQLNVFLVFFVCYNLAFSFGRLLMTDWYYLPGFVAYFIVFGRSVDTLITKGKTIGKHSDLHYLYNGAVVVVLLGLGVVGAKRWKIEPHGTFFRNQVVGNWLRDNAPARSGLMLEPIGYIGWTSKLYIHDYFGLVSPAVIEYRKKYVDSDGWYMRYIHDVGPEIVALRKWEIEGDTLFFGHGERLFRDATEKEWFHTNYVEIPWNAGMRSNWDYMMLFVRKSLRGQFSERGG